MRRLGSHSGGPAQRCPRRSRLGRERSGLQRSPGWTSLEVVRFKSWKGTVNALTRETLDAGDSNHRVLRQADHDSIEVTALQVVREDQECAVVCRCSRHLEGGGGGVECY